ncbi:hypothetical protein [Novosphingobium sp. P6W]|uniref:hypothetical protein n=1 Tax=Novosphingobium sp. P6W TaxID=1609758 RepID=UPI000B050534|nr:hypothetical protein [Novosphingobium sp. P6W]AXB80712.1 hypothetical protein TQ38_029620 [Novosphingobium sp. P6W]
MVPIDVEALRAQVRAMDYLRGTPDEVTQWRENMAESRANLAIEDMILSADENATFAMMLVECNRWWRPDLPKGSASAQLFGNIGLAGVSRAPDCDGQSSVNVGAGKSDARA